MSDPGDEQRSEAAVNTISLPPAVEIAGLLAPPAELMPQSSDAVLGGDVAPPLTGGVLGGLAGVKWRLASPHRRQRLAALPEALNYGSPGLDLLLQALTDADGQIRQAAFGLLWHHAKVSPSQWLQQYEPPLISDVEADFQPLQWLLQRSEWEQADLETARLMLRIADCLQMGYLADQDSAQFPVTDFRTIDHLWLKYSQGHFGFTVQQSICLRHDLNFGRDREAFKQFSQKVGWGGKNGFWYDRQRLTFNLSAPAGHLPGWIGWDDEMIAYDAVLFGGKSELSRRGWRLLVSRRELYPLVPNSL